MARRKDPLLTQALLQSTVRYGAEGSALRELLREAKVNLESGLKFEKGAAQGIIAATKAATPQIVRGYEAGARTREDAHNQLSRDLRNLSAAADPYKAVSAREFAGSQRRMGEAMASALREMSQRRVSAREGQVFAQRNLRSQYQGDVGKIRLRQAELAREEGAFKASTYEDLVAAQREANRKAADDAEQRRHNRVLESQGQQRIDISKTKGKPKKGGPTRTQRINARESFENALSIAESIEGATVAELTDFLVQEKDIDAVFARAAAQAANSGGVDGGLARTLWRRYRLKVPKKRGTPPRPPRAPGPNGEIRPG